MIFSASGPSAPCPSSGSMPRVCPASSGPLFCAAPSEERDSPCSPASQPYRNTRTKSPSVIDSDRLLARSSVTEYRSFPHTPATAESTGNTLLENIREHQDVWGLSTTHWQELPHLRRPRPRMP